MKNSIRRDLSIRLSFMLFIIGTIIGVSYSLYSVHHSQQEFDNEITQQTQNISSMLTLQLWLFDISTTQKLCSHLLNSSLITGITVLDSERQNVFQGGVLDGENITRLHRELIHDTALVGYMDISFSKESLSQQIKSLRAIGLYILLGSAAASFLLVNFLLKKHLSTPLAQLKNSMKLLADGKFQGSTLKSERVEIQDIIDSFNDLVEKLKERDSEIFEKTTRLEHEIAERKKANNIFKALAGQSSTLVEQEVYNSIVTKTCELFECEVAMLGQLVDHKTLRILALSQDGKFQEKTSYDITGTPANVVLQQGFTAFPENITELFPDAIALKKMQAKGYVGTPLLRGDNKAIGILCAISHKKLVIPKQAKEILDILQARAVGELDKTKMREDKHLIEYRLRQAQKMEAVGTLAGGIAHDFNNILTAIMGYADMAKEEAEPGSELEDDLEKVIAGGNRAKDLVKQILAFSRQNHAELISFQPASVINEAIKMLRSSIPTTIDIQQNIDPISKAIFADPTQIHQIIINLCTNAFHAMEESGGNLLITLQNINIDHQAAAENHELKVGEYVELRVDDTGSGISADIQERIFEPYFTTKQVDKGTGMGLAIIHGIVQSYDGAITVKSEVGKGTSFQVLFPACKEAPTSESKENQNLLRGSERIIFVDDEEILTKMGSASLGRLGYKVTAFTDSIKALEAFKANPDQFDLIITDQTMPKLTGAEMAKTMLKIRPDIPIILCTGYSTIISKEESQSMGIREFVLKPISRKSITTLIRNIFDN